MLLKKKEINPLDKKVIDNIRGLCIDMIDEAGSGHPGIALGAAPILYSLYANHLRFDVNNTSWINRDRFVLSAGHGSALLYSILYMAGFDISLDDLKNFRKKGSKTPGHPELYTTPGVDVSTGPLGQGIANAVGMAIGRNYLNKTSLKDVVDFDVYALCGDGDLMEGISYEACSLAGTLKLNNLILLYDSNNVTLDGKLSDTFNEDIKKRFEAMNWNYILVSDSEDLVSINDAITQAKNSNLPTIIEFKTTIGKYSKYEGTNSVHGKTLDSEDITNIKEKLGLRNIPFQVSDEALNHFRQVVQDRNDVEITSWMEKFLKLTDEDKVLFEQLLNSKASLNVKNLYFDISEEGVQSVREASSQIIKSFSENYPFVIGGSADVASSTMVNFDGDKCIKFGIREHSMGGIANGLALVGLTPIVSTFLSFSDYLKPSIRMSAMMNLPVVYIFTHDSISVGEDGPTHQPVEQLISLRAIPNLDVYRPADVNEVMGCFNSILESRNPSVIALSRNKLPILQETKTKEVKQGAYIVKEETSRLDGILISTGEDLNTALNVANNLKEKGYDFRVISMPSIEKFRKNDKKYQESILPNNKNTFVIEMSSSYSWDNFVINRDHLFTVDTFGISASFEDIKQQYKFDEKYIEKRIEELIK